MFDQIITECTIFNPTLERAFKVAPKKLSPHISGLSIMKIARLINFPTV